MRRFFSVDASPRQLGNGGWQHLSTLRVGRRPRVIIDASDTASGEFFSFVFATDQNNMRPENAQFPFINTGTNTDAEVFQIGQTDALNLGAGPTIDLGEIFPPGIPNFVALSEYLPLAEYASDLGQGGQFDLIPSEPSSSVLLLLGMVALVARRRRRYS